MSEFSGSEIENSDNESTDPDIGDTYSDNENTDTDTEIAGSDESNDEDSDSSDEEESDYEAAIDGKSEDEYNIDDKIEGTIFNCENNFTYKLGQIKNIPSNVLFSPTSNILGVTTVNGDVEIFDCCLSEISKLARVECFSDDSCIDLDFSRDGLFIYSISSNGGIVVIDVDTQRMCNFSDLDQENHLTTVRTVNSWAVLTGDDNGRIKLWDSRQFRPNRNQICIGTGADLSDDYVSYLLVHSNGRLVASASGAGVLTVFDLRTLRHVTQNQPANSDLTSLCTVRNEETIVGSSLKGEFVFAGWKNENSDCHTFEGVANLSCNGVCRISDDKIVSIWEDHWIRLHSVFPHKLLGLVGEQPFPPEYLDVSCDQKFIATAGFDKKLYVWNVKNILKQTQNSPKKTNINKNVPNQLFFSNL